MVLLVPPKLSAFGAISPWSICAGESGSTSGGVSPAHWPSSLSFPPPGARALGGALRCRRAALDYAQHDARTHTR